MWSCDPRVCVCRAAREARTQDGRPEARSGGSRVGLDGAARSVGSPRPPRGSPSNLLKSARTPTIRLTPDNRGRGYRMDDPSGRRRPDAGRPGGRGAATDRRYTLGRSPGRTRRVRTRGAEAPRRAPAPTSRPSAASALPSLATGPRPDRAPPTRQMWRHPSAARPHRPALGPARGTRLRPRDRDAGGPRTGAPGGAPEATGHAGAAAQSSIGPFDSFQPLIPPRKCLTCL